MQVLDLTARNPCLDESLLNCTGQAQQARLSGVFPAELGVELLDEVLGHLVLITLNMRADVDAYVLGTQPVSAMSTRAALAAMRAYVPFQPE